MGDLHRAFVDKQDGIGSAARGTSQPVPPAGAAIFVVTPLLRLFLTPEHTLLTSNVPFLRQLSRFYAYVTDDNNNITLTKSRVVAVLTSSFGTVLSNLMCLSLHIAAY